MKRDVIGLRVRELRSSPARQYRGEGGIHDVRWSTPSRNVPTHRLAAQAVALLVRTPRAVISLAGAGEDPYELVVAEILLQRTTAAGVARAFPRYPTWVAMAGASLEELQEALRPLGLWKQKARALLDLANVVEKRGGELPCSRRDLERLPGIGPKPRPMMGEKNGR